MFTEGIKKVGNICHAQFKITQKTLGTGSNSLLQGFPFNSANLAQFKRTTFFLF